MKFVCYNDWNHLPESANALFEKGEKNSIFFSRRWFESLTDAALDNDDTMVLACVVAGNEVVAILPLMKSTGKTWYSLKHRYATHYSLLLADDNQQQILDCLVQGLNRLSVHSLLLEPVADNDSRIIGLQRTMEMVGFRCELFFRQYNWIYRVQGQSYDDYMAARPARLRNTISRKGRKLDREHGYQIRLFTGEEVPHVMSDYYAVFRASWKANEQYVDLLDTIVAAFSRPGWSRLAILYVRELPIAAQLWFVLHGKASIFRLAYDDAWRQYSPGSILTSFMMEYVIVNDEVKEIDFLTGNDAYKQDWMSDRRERFAMSCVRRVEPASVYERFVGSLKQVLKTH